jgi:hypothetical protein
VKRSDDGDDVDIALPLKYSWQRRIFIRKYYLNIMFHALMGRFQLELFIFITYFSTVVLLNNCVIFPVGL